MKILPFDSLSEFTSIRSTILRSVILLRIRSFIMAGPKPTLELANMARYDLLQRNERKYQHLWQEQALLDIDAPVDRPQMKSGNELAQSC